MGFTKVPSAPSTSELQVYDKLFGGDLTTSEVEAQDELFPAIRSR
jgi:hypothetical protein